MWRLGGDEIRSGRIQELEGTRHGARETLGEGVLPAVLSSTPCPLPSSLCTHSVPPPPLALGRENHLRGKLTPSVSHTEIDDHIAMPSCPPFGGVQSETDMVAGLYGPCTYLPTLLCKHNTELQNLPAMWETWFQSLGWEDPLKKGKATHSSILA